PASVPSGAKYSSVLYSVPPSDSLTPIARYTPASAAAAPSRPAAGDGTSTALASSRPVSLPSDQAGVRHTQSGYPGTNASGNTTSDAPAAAAVAVSSQARSTVASRSRNTGVACTAATTAFAADSAVVTGTISLWLDLLDPAVEIRAVHRGEQSGMIRGHMPADHLDHFVVGSASGHEPAFAVDRLGHRGPLRLHNQ